MASPPAIALDTSLLDDPTTGIGLYASCLSTALERLGVRVRRVGARKSGEAPRGDMRATQFTLTKLPGILAEGSEPLFHAVGNFNLPLQRIPGKRLVLTVHDLIPVLLPQAVSAAYRWQFRLWLPRSLRVADRIICVSASARADLLKRYRVSPEKISVIHHGVDHVDAVPAPDATSEAFLRTLALPKQFVLYLGSMDVRKNVTQLLDASESLRRAGRPFTLVLVGQRWFGSNVVERRLAAVRAAGCDVRVLEHQSAPICYALMRRAALFVFPSLYEGFGLPPLEAMQLGVPVVVSDRGSLPEVCGDAATYASPENVEQLAEAIDGLLRSPEERQRRSAAGRRHAASFTWERTAQQTLNVYLEALNAAEAA